MSSGGAASQQPQPTASTDTSSRHLAAVVTAPSGLPFAADLPIAVIITDAAGTVTFWSPAATRLYGFTAEHAVGAPIYELTVGPSETRIAEEIMAAVLNGLPWEGEFVAHRADGAEVPVRVLDLPVLDASGAVAGIVGLSYGTAVDSDELDVAVDALGRLAGVVHESRRAERRRLARDLHDGLGQVLAVLSTEVRGVLEAGVVGNAQAAHHLEHVRSLVDRAVSDLRATCDSLVERQVHDPLGMATTIHRRALEVQQRAGIKVLVDLDPVLTGGPTGITVGGDVAEAVQRIVDEALNNCERHSAARRIDVQLSHVDGMVVGLVSDDGVGLSTVADDRDARRGLGMSTMTERARELGGHLTVGARPGGGTQVEFSVPAWRRT